MEADRATLVRQLVRNNDLITKLISDFAGTDLPDPSIGRQSGNPWPHKDYMEYNLYGHKQPRQARRVRDVLMASESDYASGAKRLRRTGGIGPTILKTNRSKLPKRY